jgi:outer membrane protein OmpA-like peptidoglycan-associated protein
MKKILALLLLSVIFVQNSFGQTNTIREKSLGVTFFLNDFITPQRIRSTSLSAVLRDKTSAKIKDMGPGVAINYIKGITSQIDFSSSLGASFVKIPLPGKTNTDDKFLLEADASANFKMLREEAKVNPYLIAGIGASKYSNIYGAFIPLGGGIKLNFFNETQFHIQFQYRVPVTTEANNYHFQFSLGISDLLGDKKIAPPPPPPPPADSDGDGIVDNVDACPTVFGLAKYQGCPVPDTDKDGINDEQDKCPQVAGVAKYAGCPVPDTDNDGINDDDDKCPTVAGVARYNGCPVPDTDNDGVNDEEDKCPTVPGTKANNGCPEVSKEVVTKMEYAAKRIFFITGSAKLSSKSNAALNEVIKILNDDQALKLSIEGHTDNVGKADYNKTLSDKRANSVKTYLVNKGVDESRLTAEGFGMDMPVADNKTVAGKAKNRRVELKLNY